MFSLQAQVYCCFLLLGNRGALLLLLVSLKQRHAATHNLCCQPDYNLTSCWTVHSILKSIWLWGEKSRPKPALPFLPEHLLEQRQEGGGSTGHVPALPKSHVLSCLLPPGVSHSGQHGLPLLPSKPNTTGEDKADTPPGWILDLLCQQFSSAVISPCFWTLLLICKPLARERAELPHPQSTNTSE